MTDGVLVRDRAARGRRTRRDRDREGGIGSRGRRCRIAASALPPSSVSIVQVLPSSVTASSVTASSGTSSGTVHVSPLGSASVSTTPSASSGPLLVTVRSNATGAPLGDAGRRALLREREVRRQHRCSSRRSSSRRPRCSSMSGVVNSSVGTSSPRIRSPDSPLTANETVSAPPVARLDEPAIGVVRQPQLLAAAVVEGQRWMLLECR